MKKQIYTVITAIMMAVSAQANDNMTNDTTVNYQGRKYIIGTNDTETKITVYEKDSVKIKESVFADGNKIERTYVSSPFAGDDELQSMKFKPMLPTFWFGSNILKGGLFKSGDKTGGRFGGSFEAGITPLRMAIPLDKAKTFGIISGAQLVFSRYCFDKNFGMRMSDGLVERVENSAVTANNMFFGALRVPLLLSIQEPGMPGTVSVGVSFEARTNAKYNFKSSDNTTGMADGLRLNRFGINMEMYVNYGPAYLGLKAGLTPIYKTTDGVKAHTASVTIGADINGIIRMFKKKQ